MSQVPIEIVRSRKRTKTVQARLIDGRVRVMVPAGMGDDEATRWAAELAGRIARKAVSGRIDLPERARALGTRHGLPMPRSIQWSERQRQRWGSCTPATGSIRISARLAGMPPWVLDYVILHEMAHLVEADHGPGFERLISRYPLAERARGYLAAKAES